MTDEPTFDIEIPDASPDDIAALVGGIGIMVAQALQHGAQEKAEGWASVTERLLLNNQEAARYMFIESDVAEHTHGQLPDHILDELGLEQHGGQFYEAGEFKDIDVE